MKSPRLFCEHRLKRFLWLVFLSAGGVYSNASVGGPGAVELDVIARDGEAAPAGDGDFDLSFSVSAYPGLVIDNDAVVYFDATTTASKRGIWSGTGAFIDDIAVNGQVLFNFQPTDEECEGFGAGCGEIFNISTAFYVTPPGEILVRVNRQDNLSPIAYLAGTSNADLAPLITSLQVENFPFSGGLQTEAGEYLIGPYVGTAPFGEPDGGLEDFAAKLIDGPAPFIPDPITISDIFGTDATSVVGVIFGFNERGDRLFVAELSDGGEALYFDPMAEATASNLLARTGESVPGIAGVAYTHLTDTLTVGRTGRARVNDAGQGYFVAHWRDPNGCDCNNNLPRDGIWSFDNGGAPVLVMSEHRDLADPVFGTSEFPRTGFDNLVSPLTQVAPNGDIYFYARGRAVDTDGFFVMNDERVGLWRFSVANEPLDLVLRVTTSDAPGSSLPDGPNVPGTPLPGGGNFTGLGLSFYGIDEHGHLVFDTADGVYAEDAFGLRLVLKKGQDVEIEPGDSRTVSTFRISNFNFVGDTLMGYRNDRLALRVGFTDGSNAILRTRFLPPPPPPKLVGLEVTQVVQDWNNSIPLIADKQTLVRAHIESPEPIPLHGRLAGTRGGVALSMDPIHPSNPGGYIFAPPDPLDRRGFYSESLHFELPLSWTAKGQVEFQVSLDSETLDCAEVAGPAANDCRVTVTFTDASPLPLKLVDLFYEKSPDFFPKVGRLRRQKMICQLVSSMPVSARQTCKIDWTDAEVRWPMASNPPKTSEMLAYMKTWRRKDGCRDEDGCTRLYQGISLVDKVSGLGAVGGTASAAYVRPSSRSAGATSHIHEFVHNLGRRHSVHSSLPLKNGKLQSPCGATAPLMTPDFPHFFMIDGKPRSTLGPMESGDDRLVYGVDIRKIRIADPFKVFDLMDYCRTAPIMRWPAKVTYETVRTSMAARFPVAPARAKGVATDYLVVTGTINRSGRTVQFLPATILPGINPPVTVAGDYSARFLDSGGQPVATVSFEPEIVGPDGDAEEFGIFQIEVAANPAIQSVEISDALGIIGELTASASPPTVTITAPVAGTTQAGDTVVIEWEADDADDGPLYHTVHYSPDDGSTWALVVADWPQTQYETARFNLPASEIARMRVTTSDGFNASSDVSGQFTVTNNPPLISIESPETGSLYTASQRIAFAAATQDTEDGAGGADVEWSSSIDGLIGISPLLELSAQSLSVGTHEIMATAIDSDNGQDNDTVFVTITAAAPEVMSDFDVEAVPRALEIVPGDPVTFLVTIRNNGPQDSLNSTLSLTLVDEAVAPAAAFDSVAAPEGVDCALGSSLVECAVVGLALSEVAAVEVVVRNTGDGTLTLIANLDVGGNIDPRLANNVSEAVVLTSLVQDVVFANGFETR